MKLFPTLLAAALLSGASAEEPTDTRVGAYYYPWYGESGRHWHHGYEGMGDGSGPALGEYDSRSSAVVRQHITWSREIGIDHWICSWWGPGSWEDETLLREVLPELDGVPVKFCLFYEAEGLLGLDPERGIEFDERKTESFAGHFRWMAERYFAHPAYLKIEDRPVVYLYLSRAFAGNHARALARARAACSARGFDLYLVGDEVYWHEPDPGRLRLFDAVTAYNLHGPPEFADLGDWSPFIEACDGVYQRWSAACRGVGVDFIPGVMPGFDSRETEGGDRHYVIPRVLSPGQAPDSFFAAMAKMARRHLGDRRPQVAITSFNEWHEGTQIEPSRDASRNTAAAIVGDHLKSP